MIFAWIKAAFNIIRIKTWITSLFDLFKEIKPEVVVEPTEVKPENKKPKVKKKVAKK